MKEETKKEIDGFEYTFYQLGAIKSHNLLRKIGKILGPALGEMVNSAKDSDKAGLASLLNSEIDFKSVIDGFFDRADEKTLESIIITLGSQIHYTDGGNGGELKSSDIIDLHFKGRLQSMYKVLYAALEVQYSDFLGEGGILANIQLKAKDSRQKK